MFDRELWDVLHRSMCAQIDAAQPSFPLYVLDDESLYVSSEYVLQEMLHAQSTPMIVSRETATFVRRHMTVVGTFACRGGGQPGTPHIKKCRLYVPMYDKVVPFATKKRVQ